MVGLEGGWLGGLGRMYVLALLGEMTQDGLIQVWAVPHCIEVGETIKGVAVACLDGIQLCLLNWKTHACMVESNESSHAGKVKALRI
jgi:hypothetical protein